MLERSSNFVKVVFADKNRILDQLRHYVIKIRQNRPEVEKIGLFGSYAADTYGPASDVDLLIIVRQSSRRFLDRIPDYLPENLSTGCDVFPYTVEEVERMKQEGMPWIRRVLKEVVWL
jgi:predicted nucleotidyltransferase